MTWDPSILSWAHARLHDLEAREFERSLETVGSDKPLGSFGFRDSGEAARAQAGLAPGLHSLRTTVHRGGGTWLHAWDPEGVQRVLFAHGRDTLPPVWRFAVWRGKEPKVLAVIRRIIKRPVSPQTPLFDLIADLYGDKTGPGRTDVLPGIPRERLFAAFEEVAGFSDPTCVYFPQFRHMVTR